MLYIIILTILTFSCRHIDKKNIFTNNADLIIAEDSVKSYLTNCEVIKSDDSLFLNFSDTVKLSNYYELRIIKIENNFSVHCYQNFMLLDSSYKPPVFTVISQTIMLNQKEYQKGDDLKGKLFLKILSSNQWPEVYQDTIRIQGDFFGTVQ